MELHTLISEKIDFNDEHLRQAWQKVVLRRMRETEINNKEEVFITTAIMLFSKLPEGLQVRLKTSWPRPGIHAPRSFGFLGAFPSFSSRPIGFWRAWRWKNTRPSFLK